MAGFMEGRVPKKVGARHYAKLLRQADGYYGRYKDYLGRLRNCQDS
jgi:intergrase/recombinase